MPGMKVLLYGLWLSHCIIGVALLLSLDSTFSSFCLRLSISAGMRMLRILGEDEVPSDLFDLRIPWGSNDCCRDLSLCVSFCALLSRLARYFYSLMSQSLTTILAVVPS